MQFSALYSHMLLMKAHIKLFWLKLICRKKKNTINKCNHQIVLWNATQDQLHFLIYNSMYSDVGWFHLFQLHPPPWWSFLHRAAEEHRERTSAGLLPCSKCKPWAAYLEPLSTNINDYCYWNMCTCLSKYLLSSLLDHGGGDEVLRGVHQDSAHRLRGVRSLSEAALPSALQRPDQVWEKCNI